MRAPVANYAQLGTGGHDMGAFFETDGLIDVERGHSAEVTATPQFVEQGREQDELVRRNGRCYFKQA